VPTAVADAPPVALAVAFPPAPPGLPLPPVPPLAEALDDDESTEVALASPPLPPRPPLEPAPPLPPVAVTLPEPEFVCDAPSAPSSRWAFGVCIPAIPATQRTALISTAR